MNIDFDFKKARKELHLTLQQAAKVTGVPATTLWNIEHATHDTGAKRIAALQAVYEEILEEHRKNG